MRYLIITLLVMVFSFSLFAQKKFIFPEKYFDKTEKTDDVKLNIKIQFKPNVPGSFGSLSYSGNVDTVSNGFFYINESNGFGTGPNAKSLLNNSFFGPPFGTEDIYDSVLTNRIFNLEKIYDEKTFTKILFFQMNKRLIDSEEDSIALFFKYAIYDLLDHPEKFHYNFDVKLYHKMIIVPFNEVVPLNDLSKHFEGYSATLAITKTTKEERELYSKFTAHNFDQIYEAIEESKIRNEKFNLGLEFVRSDKSNKNILLRQLEYPLESAMVLRDVENEIPINLPTQIYKGEFKVPFTIMNKEKAKKYAAYKSAESFLQSKYNIFVVPIEYRKDNLLLDVFIEYTKVKGFFPRPIKKRLTIGKGGKLKLEIPTPKTLYRFNVNLEDYEIDGYEDYDKYVNEYIVISFEYAEKE